MSRRDFWERHAGWPALGFILAVATLRIADLDFAVADFFYDPAAQEFSLRSAFWSQRLLHDGGARLILLVGIGALAVLVHGTLAPRWRAQRRAAAYVLACLALCPGLAAIGKNLTNVDCPWDLERYGGNRPYVQLFDDRPDALPSGACFPGAHSAGGFALFAFYFLWRGPRPRRAQRALAGALAIGTLYALTQWLRGAHFVSHDLWSAFLAWNICLAAYAACFSAQLSAEFAAAPPAGLPA